MKEKLEKEIDGSFEEAICAGSDGHASLPVCIGIIFMFSKNLKKLLKVDHI